jgi:flagellar biosynthesis chaperone FliJ
MAFDADNQPTLDELLKMADKRVAELAAKYDTLDPNAPDYAEQIQQLQHEAHNIRYAQLMAVLTLPDGQQKLHLLCHRE